MALVPIENVGQLGIIKDTPPYSLPPNAWSGGNNVRFLDSGVKKCAGYQEILATCPFAPYYLMPLDDNGTYYWIAFGLKSIAVHNGSSWTDVTRQTGDTVDGAINNSVTTITLDDASGFPSSGTIAMGTKAIADGVLDGYEEVTYSGKSTNDLTGCSRGANSTTAAPHSDDATVVPVGSTSTSDRPYNATAAENWQATILNGLLVATNGFDVPQMWPLASGSPSLSVPMRDLQNWPSTTGVINTDYCKSIQAFKTFLIGLNWNRTDVESRLVKWSTEASSFNAPNTWSETDNTLDAGEYELADTPGGILDGLPLGDSFLIYKEDSVYAMNYVGTPYIFSFKLLSPTVGLLAKNAVAKYEGGHFFIGNTDCYVNNGQTLQALLPGRMRREMFTDLNGDEYKKCFVVADHTRGEMLACYPSSTATECNKALIWNWKNNTFSIRDLPELTHINSGIASITTGNAWNSNAETWNTGTGYWGTGNYDNVLKNLIFVQPAEVAAVSGATAADPVVITSATHGLVDSDLVVISDVVGMTELNGNSYYAKVTGYSTTTFALYSDSSLSTKVDGSGYTAYTSGGVLSQPKLFRDDKGNQNNTVDMISYVERTGHDLGDPSSMKFVRAVWPKLEVSGDNEINVYVGSQMSTEDGISWDGPTAYNPGTQSKVSCRTNGKLFGVKFESTTDIDWTLHGVEFELAKSGRRGGRSY